MKQSIVIYSINTKVYLVHKDYKDKQLQNGKIIPARVKTYENKKGQIIPICHAIGDSKKHPLSTDCYYLFTNINDAVQAICTTPLEFESIEPIKVARKPSIDLFDTYRIEAMKGFVNAFKTWNEGTVSECVIYSNAIAEEMMRRKKN